MKCLKCGEEFSPRHKYHEFCSKLCRIRNYFGKEKVVTKKPFVPKKKKEKEFFDWTDPMY